MTGIWDLEKQFFGGIMLVLGHLGMAYEGMPPHNP
jgi:hypothetical protein